MAEDNEIRAKVTADASGLESGMQDAVNITQEALDQLKAEYEAASIVVKQTTSDMADANKKLGNFAQQGVTEAASVLADYKNKLAAATVEQQRLSAALQEATAAFSQNAVASTEAAEASGYSKAQLAAIASAATIAARQIETLAAIQTEAASSIGDSSAEMQSIYVRALTEMRLAGDALANSQRLLGPAAAEGAGEAAAAIESLEDSYIAAAAVVGDLKVQIAGIAETEAAAAGAAAGLVAPTEALATATALAATQSANLASIQSEVAAATGASSAELRTVYVRAATEARTAASALAQAQRTIGPAAAQGSAEASAALKILQTNFQTASAFAAELQARVKLLQLAEADTTAETVAEARAQAELAIAEHGSAESALEAANAQNTFANGSIKARVELAALQGSTLGMAYALSKLAAASEALQPIIQSIFPIALGFAFIGILKDVAGEIGNVIDAMAGWDSFAKKMYADLEAENDKALFSYLQISNQIDKIKEVGVAGFAKLGAEASNNSAEIARLNNELNINSKALSEEEKQLKALDLTKIVKPLAGADSIMGVFTGLFSATEGMTSRFIEGRRAQLEESIKKTHDDVNRLTEQLKEASQVQAPRIKAEQGAEGTKEFFEIQQQKLEEQKKTGLASAALEKESAEQRFADQRISLEAEYEALKKSEADRFAVESEYVSRHNALMRERQEATGQFAGLALSQQEQNIDHQRRLDALALANSRQVIKDAEEINKHLEETLIKKSELEAKDAEETAPEGTGQRAKLADLQKQEAGVRALQDVVPALYAKIQQDIIATTKSAGREQEIATKKVVDDQYEIWVAGGNRSLQQIIYFWNTARGVFFTNAELVKEADEKIANATKKLSEDQEKAAKTAVASSEAQIAGALELKRLEEERANALAVFKAPTAKTDELAQQRDIDQQIIQAKIAAAQQELAIDQQYGSARAAEVQKDEEKIQQIRAQGAQKIYADDTKILEEEQKVYTNFFNTLNQGFIRAFDQMLTTHKSFAQGVQKIWQGMLTQFYNFLAQELLHYVENEALKLARAIGFDALLTALHLKSAAAATTASTTANSIQISQTATSQAAQQAIIVAAGEAEIQTYAAVAGAAVTAAVAAESLGDIAVAIAAGVAAYATVASTFGTIAAFEKGGVIPNTGVALVHKGEAVLPSHLTNMLTNVANNRGGDRNINVGGIHINGNFSTGGRNPGRDSVGELTRFARRNNYRMA